MKTIKTFRLSADDIAKLDYLVSRLSGKLVDSNRTTVIEDSIDNRARRLGYKKEI